MMTKAHRQEALSRAYVSAVAAQAGVSVSVPRPDYGIDMTLRHVIRRGRRYAETGHGLDVQLKSVTQADVAGPIDYDLDVKAYNDLRGASFGTPRVLLLLVLPADQREWTAHSEAALELRRCCYWLSLFSRPPTGNARSIRVQIPREQVFSPASLRAMMNRIRRGELP